jgi:hypothetical protein
MKKVGMASRQGGDPAPTTRRLALLIRKVGDRLFHAEDARARQYGWQVTARRGGLARTYRDPRFDRFRSCPACSGTGRVTDERPCDGCGGTGRVTIIQPVANLGRDR